MRTQGLTVVVDQPLAARVTTVVRRAIAYASLSSTPNADKRVAVFFYNYPPGKATIGTDDDERGYVDPV